MNPLLIVLSAPSGGGKTTLCDRLLQDYPEITYSVSCTTRTPRGAEEDGIDYYFMTPQRFEEHLRAGHFLEHAQVHDHYYGTLIEPLREAIAEGQSVLLDIDVEGAAQIRANLARLAPDDSLRRGLIDIFIQPPSMLDLKQRLENRGEDDAKTIEKRLGNAEKEMQRAAEFRYRIVNNDLDMAYRDLCAIIENAAGIRRDAPRGRRPDGPDAKGDHGQSQA